MKKTELYSSQWASCDELRGGMDASQYKEDVLTLLFMKYVSDKYKGGPYGMNVVPEETSFDDMMARLKLATDDDEVAALKQAKKLFDAESAAKKALKRAQEALLLAVFKHYPELNEADIKTLIVKDKWSASLRAGVQAEIERVIQQLVKRVTELEERCAEPLPATEASVQELGKKVAEHSKAMRLNV